jgi:hypothetical protein
LKHLGLKNYWLGNKGTNLPYAYACSLYNLEETPAMWGSKRPFRAIVQTQLVIQSKMKLEHVVRRPHVTS